MFVYTYICLFKTVQKQQFDYFWELFFSFYIETF